jgi:hypothetical protein
MSGMVKRVRIAALVAVVLLLLPVVYALSTGPAVYLGRQGVFFDPTFNAYANPVFQASKTNRIAGLWLVRYWAWWGDLSGKPARGAA